ncbi:MAG: geranylgeranylglyceryl/heptaprenylglyceryl phosphate synthase [Candidatus Aenigmarchaeota archaeon]|nr:geranylgeranylglyceryl/heptaprenylglyceryl phosphate synthase [Candidatus Aenigmarchaeota archaeon]
MKPGKVEKYIHEKIESDGALLLSLIDPDSQPFEVGAKIAEASAEAGADAILIGGSIGAQGMLLDKTTKMIRERVNIPIILFPGNVGTITPFADATYFMYVLNSREVYWISTVQIQGAPVVKRMGLEAIPTGYMILEPGRAVGWISNANLVPRNRPDLAAVTALAGEMMGARIIVADSGSGAPSPASPELISAIKSQLTVPFIYGGGCRSPQQVKDIIKAGADGVQIGTAFEMEGSTKEIQEKVGRMVNAVKEAAKERRTKIAKKGKLAKIKQKMHFPRFDLTNITRRFKKQKKNDNGNGKPVEQPVQQPKK